jgi:ABC-2 type transport system permease protein/oleandomycin transport system permease protein
MTDTTETAAPTTIPQQSIQRFLSDAVVLTKRNLLKYRRVPTLLVFSTVQPVMFVLLFVFVFGGAIQLPGDLSYTNFIMAGIFAQVVIFGSTQTGVGLADDMGKGLIDRFRSLPMSRSAVLIGRTSSDAVRNVFVMLLVSLVGFLVGFRFEDGIAAFALALLLAVLFGYAFSWISATIGLAVGDVETAQAATFVWIFPLVFASSAFVPIETFPDWLQTFARLNPVTSVVNAMRALILGTPLHPWLWQTFAWIAVLLIIFIPLAVREYRRALA